MEKKANQQNNDTGELIICAMCPYCEEEVELYTTQDTECPNCGLHFQPSEEEIAESIANYL
jgi:Zn ribbon nucleic-acid-binding protein